MAPSAVNPRSCNGCTLCCKVMAVDALEKPANSWCTHCDIGQGCRIYEDRPVPCREFVCWYIQDSSVSEEWYPLKSHMVVTTNLRHKQLIVHVDRQRGDAWKREPYHTMLRNYAGTIYPRGGQVMVRIGGRTIMVLPDRDVDLGICADDDVVTCLPKQTPLGVRWDVTKAVKM